MPDASTEAGYAVMWTHQNVLDPSVLWQMSSLRPLNTNSDGKGHISDSELLALRHAITGLYLSRSGTQVVASQPSTSNLYLVISSTSTDDVLCDGTSVYIYSDDSGSKLYIAHGDVLHGNAHAAIVQEASAAWLPAPLRLRCVESHVIREKQVLQSCRMRACVFAHHSMLCTLFRLHMR